MKILLLLFFFSTNLFAFTFPNNFEFGVASAPAHVEDDLQDPWLDFARNGHVKAFYNTPFPEMRVAFWTEPDKEIELLKDLNLDVYRMGVSWSRLIPMDPIKENGEIKLEINKVALNRYLEIIKSIKSSNIKIMLTLFHHSMPKWAHEHGGFKNKNVQKAFLEFSKVVVENLKDHVDYWITFNEPNVYSFLTHIQGMWPYGEKSLLAGLKLPFFQGRFFDELDGMAKSHRDVFKMIKLIDPTAKISVAQNYAYYQGQDFFGKLMASWSSSYMNAYFVDKIIDEVDFLGMNYYGVEYFKNGKLIFDPKTLYSESGRGVSPYGFFELLKEAHKKYQKEIFITENGIADRTDIIRPPYLVEHLKAISLSMEEGVKVLGYIHWTLSDNWEWADGYCPKFGLVAVDRENDFERIKRPSYEIYKTIIRTHKVDEVTYKKIWQNFLTNPALESYLCRDEDQENALDDPRKVRILKDDWSLKTK